MPKKERRKSISKAIMQKKLDSIEAKKLGMSDQEYAIVQNLSRFINSNN